MQNTIDTWNGYTNSQTAQEFMDISRQKGLTTIEEAVTAYVTDIARDWADEGLSADEAEDIQGCLIRYLEATEGEEWQ